MAQEQLRFDGTSDGGRRVSVMPECLKGSEILKIAGDGRAMIAAGKSICNLTIGSFSLSEFPIPKFLEANIREASHRGETNDPPSAGMPDLIRCCRVSGFPF